MSVDDVDALEVRFLAALQHAETGEALEAVRAGNELFEAGGVDAVAQGLHDDFQLHVEALFLDAGTYRGVDGLRRWRADIAEAFEYDRFQPQAIRSGSDGRLAVFGRPRCKGRTSEVELNLPFVHVYEFRDAKTYRLSLYSDAAKALEAVGLSE